MIRNEITILVNFSGVFPCSNDRYINTFYLQIMIHNCQLSIMSRKKENEYRVKIAVFSFSEGSNYAPEGKPVINI